MTSEELNRAIEFIIQQQAQVSIDLDALAKHQDRDHEWAKGLFAQMAVQDQRLTELIAIQSRRLDRAEREDQAAQKRHEELIREMRARLDRILDKLSEKPN